VLLVSSLQSGKAWQACAQQTEKPPLPRNLRSFTSSLCACPASSEYTECIFSTYGLVWYNIRNSLDAEKAKELVKIYGFHRAEEYKQNLFKLFELFFFFSSPSNFVAVHFI